MGNVSEIADAELIRRVIANAASGVTPPRGRTVPLWHKVSDSFSLGSTYSAQLCERFGFNPEQRVRP